MANRFRVFVAVALPVVAVLGAYSRSADAGHLGCSGLGLGFSDACEVNVTCFDNVPEVRAAVLLQYAPSGTPQISGTGVLIQSSLFPGRPFILTAAHLLDLDDNLDITDAEIVDFQTNARVGFRFQANCDGQQPTTPVFVQGVNVIAADLANGMVLVEANTTLAELVGGGAEPYYVGWDILQADPLAMPFYVEMFHHPCGDVKKASGGENPSLLSLSNPDLEPKLLLPGWTCGGSESGSSGAPLIDGESRLLVGVFNGDAPTDPGPINPDPQICPGDPAMLVFSRYNGFANQFLGNLSEVPPFDPLTE